MSRDLSLNARPENIRSQQQIRHVVHFNLQEIKDRFDNSIQNIENKFEKGTNFQGWSSVIMKNIFINQRRRTAKIKPANTENDTSGKCSFNEKATDNTPENNLSAHEIMSKINNCPTDHCRPFRLFLAGYSYKEIADKLALPIGTVKSRIFAARKILQSALSGYK